jgi:complex iron-sulfur molybdoenzyme family reductase subunit beta
MEKRARGEESELMDILIAYSHRDMFRLDNNYYQQIADKKLKGTEFFKVIDQRYLQGANTKKVEIKDYTFHEKVLPLPPREGGHGH